MAILQAAEAMGTIRAVGRWSTLTTAPYGASSAWYQMGGVPPGDGRSSPGPAPGSGIIASATHDGDAPEGLLSPGDGDWGRSVDAPPGEKPSRSRTSTASVPRPTRTGPTPSL